MTRTEAKELVDLFKDMARSAALHSEQIYDDRDAIVEKLLEIFPEKPS